MSAVGVKVCTVLRPAMIGAEVTDRGVAVRVWAPDHERVSIVLEGDDIPLNREKDGYCSALLEDAKAGMRYKFRVDGETYPDPASRSQPEGPHGDSVIVDARGFPWHDFTPADDHVIYEMHVGTFSREGTWRAAIEHLRDLRDLGITMIEMMPVNEFAGRFGWGYDGVDLWAPSHLYGTPDDLRAFVDSAHQLGLAVILDVVYNHLGPDGCYLRKFSDDYFTTKYKTEWGEALNFECQAVRDFIADNAAYWITDFHFDGLRVDATQSMFDSSPEHILETIATRANAFIVAENEPQDVRLLTEYRFSAMWNDDWHHSALVAATGKRDAYYLDYRGTPQEFISMAKRGFLYQGQWYAWQQQRRGTSSIGIPARKFVCYLQNHDQLANSARGERLHQITSPGKYRALTALLLLGPNTPMLFQGQEFGASSPFLYFADHHGDLGEGVAKGRREFMQQFQSVKTPIAPPNDRATFERCKLDRDGESEHLKLHRDLIALRREFQSDVVDGAVLSEHCFVLRYADDHLLLINLGPELRLDVVPEPLLAGEWSVRWSTADVRYENVWLIPAECAAVFIPSSAGSRDR